MWINRAITPKIENTLSKGKSVLLFGPRQCGKTSLVKRFEHDLYITLMQPNTLRRYILNPEAFFEEVKALKVALGRKPVVIVDEVQKIPDFTDGIQVLIDEQIAQFIITGSSARKIKNLLPGRVIKFILTPLNLLEIDPENINLNKVLINGTLPEIYAADIQDYINELLNTYVNVYIEEEIRKEALVRNISAFTNFLQLACIESGNTINLSKISADIGVSHHTIMDYYNILRDCMLTTVVQPLITSDSRKRLTKSAKYIIFDMGIKRSAANEPDQPGSQQLSMLFEQYIGIEISRILEILSPNAKLLFWRSHDGPEVDYIIYYNNKYTPIEVKWTQNPTNTDIKHLITFQKEYTVHDYCYLLCRCDKPRLMTDKIMATSWKELPNIIKSIILV